jgi:hypothetical protein
MSSRPNKTINDYYPVIYVWDTDKSPHTPLFILKWHSGQKLPNQIYT